MTSDDTPDAPSRDRLIEIRIDPNSVTRGNSAIEHEREVAIFDILDGNVFALAGEDNGPYRLDLAIADDRLVFKVTPETDADRVATHMIPLMPFKRLLKDYFLVLDSYYQAIRSGQPSRIEAIDVGRRGLHDEGSNLLMEKLDGKISVDFDTARRLFTLVAALHWKG
ncbi:MAG: UPF0262 family protein [Hyphomicrobium sp.]|nr:UPF0262 family protein [Hyphomicrobium sp.]